VDCLPVLMNTQAGQECESNSNRSIKNYRPTNMLDPYYSSLHGKKVNELCGCRVFCHVTKICKPQQLYICIYVLGIFFCIPRIFKL
jgi:hypothetical protein